MTDFETVDFFTDESLVPDPYPYFDYLRSKCPAAPASHSMCLPSPATRRRSLSTKTLLLLVRVCRGSVLRTAVRARTVTMSAS